jgi:tRNA A37 threonylcarbamoyladenosine modification protein TsaB
MTLQQREGIAYKDLVAIAVSHGPHTGLRIGVSAAKGVCFRDSFDSSRYFENIGGAGACI